MKDETKAEASVVRHLEEVGDLRDPEDQPLKRLEAKDTELTRRNAQEIIQNTETQGLHKIMIVSSPTTRACETAEEFRKAINEIAPNLPAGIRRDGRFAEPDQGDLILPSDYKVGDRVEALPSAWAAFWAETFTGSIEGYKNANYRFGDPVGFGEGQVKYPELANCFSRFGESYREVCLRSFDGIREYFENNEKVKAAGINVVLVGHTAIVGILTGLEMVLEHIQDGSYVLVTGDLMRASRLEFVRLRMTNKIPQITFGEMRSFSAKGVDEAMLDLLRAEIKFLKAPENYGKKN